MFEFSSHKTIFLTGIILSVFLVSCSKNDEKKSKPTNKAAARTHSTSDSTPQSIMAPDFTLTKMDGSVFTLSDHQGKVIVLNVWATWCPPCRKEIPGFIKIQKELRDEGVLFAGISLDRKGWDVVKPFAKEYGINYPLMVDDGTFSRIYGPFRAIPATFIIDKKGEIKFGGTGMINTKSLKKVLEKMARE